MCRGRVVLAGLTAGASGTSLVVRLCLVFVVVAFVVGSVPLLIVFSLSAVV